VYFLLVLVIQLIVNTSLITGQCGGSVAENLGTAGWVTFFPWTFLFGVILVILLLYPGFKSAFSDVIGYFYVSGSANKVLTELLINQEIEEKIQSSPTSPEEKKKMESAADAILKIFGNTSLLINQIVPENFAEYWNILQPLMKSQYKVPGKDMEDKRNELFELVVTRDNVGEAMWFMYTGILITSIVQLKMSTQGCKVNAEQVAKNYQSYLDEQEKADAAQELATSQEYTITN
jgi:hypothetical protein